MSQTGLMASQVRDAVLTRLKREFPALEAEHPDFERRIEDHFDDFWGPYSEIYSTDARLEKRAWRLFRVIAKGLGRRDHHLLERDHLRTERPDWYQDETTIGMMMYVDLFSGKLRKLDKRLDYLRELGVSYVHLMPLMTTRDGRDDGGYAVSNHRTVKREIGTTKQLRKLARDMHREGISLALDLVMNHTAREHRWARKAAAGSRKYQDFYFMFDDRKVPDAFEQTLPGVFPDLAPGSFSWVPEAEKWVWTTFNDFQWDLNFANPAVFEAMWKEMVFLANVGADSLRLDAVPFIWKRMGTDCRNQPETVLLVAAYRALMRIFAPSVCFKAEAMNSPAEIASYLGAKGFEGKACDIAYNATLMNHIWHALACENVHLLRNTLSKLPEIPAGTAWVNYVRCHDEIEWGISDQNASEVGQDGHETRKFCTDFYAGVLPESYSEGYRFQPDPASGEARISGTTAALTGLQKAIVESDPQQVDMAIRRTLLLNGIAFFMKGFPLLYSGDEIGQLNDYSYLNDPVTRSDSRWIHRPAMNWRTAKRRHDPDSVEGRLFSGIRHLADARRSMSLLRSGVAQQIVPLSNDHVFAVRRFTDEEEILMLANFAGTTQRVALPELPSTWLSGRYHDHISDATVDFSHADHIALVPYDFLWLGHAQDGPGQSQTKVDIRVQVRTQPGELIYLSGNIPQLGEWNPERALGPLDSSGYPMWRGTFDAPPGTVFEFVWMKKRDRTVVEVQSEPRVHRVNGIAKDVRRV